MTREFKDGILARADAVIQARQNGQMSDSQAIVQLLYLVLMVLCA